MRCELETGRAAFSGPRWSTLSRGMILFLSLATLPLFAAPGDAIGDRMDDGMVMSPYADTTAFRLQFENDVMFARTDWYYTNGMRFSLSFNHFVDPKNSINSTMLDLFSLVSSSDRIVRTSTGFALGQNMYTPTDITYSGLSTGDHPYNAWLYGGYFWVVGRGRRLQSLEVDLGSTGKWAGGKEAQTIVHGRTGSTLPEGWDNQTGGAPGFRINYNDSYARYFNEYLQGGGFLDLNLGNVYTNISLGLIGKIGLLNSKREDLTYHHVPPSIAAGEEQQSEIYLFVKPQITVVGYNGMLSGNGKRYYPSVDPGNREYLSYHMLLERDADEESVKSYQILVGDPSLFNRFVRYRTFSETFPSTRSYGMDYLVYNTLFNRARSIPRTDWIYVAKTLLEDPSWQGDWKSTYFVMRTLFRPTGDALPREVRFLAYYFLKENSVLRDPLREFLVYRALFEKGNPGASYAVHARPFYGTLRGGLAYESESFMASITFGMRSNEFYGGKNTPAVHEWGEFQFSVIW